MGPGLRARDPRVLAIQAMPTLCRRSLRPSLALVFAGLASAALAQTPAPALSPKDVPLFDEQFRAADRNADGRLDTEEAKNSGFFVRESFTETDRDGDGTVTIVELGQAAGARLQAWIQDRDAADTDGDGVVTRAEAQASGGGFLTIFERADRNGDGRLQDEELRAEVANGYYSETKTPQVVPNIFNKRF